MCRIGPDQPERRSLWQGFRRTPRFAEPECRQPLQCAVLIEMYCAQKSTTERSRPMNREVKDKADEVNPAPSRLRGMLRRSFSAVRSTRWSTRALLLALICAAIFAASGPATAASETCSSVCQRIGPILGRGGGGFHNPTAIRISNRDAGGRKPLSSESVHGVRAMEECDRGSPAQINHSPRWRRSRRR